MADKKPPKREPLDEEDFRKNLAERTRLMREIGEGLEEEKARIAAKKKRKK
jgi:hypothetical protein